MSSGVFKFAFSSHSHKMDPFSLTVGIVGLITSFKEVWLLSKCLYRACESAVASEQEKEKLRNDMIYEIDAMRSFGKFYLENSSVTDDAKLDEVSLVQSIIDEPLMADDWQKHWTRICYQIFEELRRLLNDYKKIDDPLYLEFSPYVNEKMYNTKMIEFSLDESIFYKEASVTTKKKSAFSLFVVRAKETTAAVGKSAKWALFEKKKLEATVASFQEGTEKLRKKLPLAFSSQLSRLEDKVDVLTATIRDPNAERLGLSFHAKVIEFNDADPNTFTDVNEKKGYDVKTVSNEPELRVSTAEWARPGSNIKEEESILVELKYYLTVDSHDGSTEPDSETENNVRQLAGLLQITSAGSSEYRTLPFKYYVHQPAQKRYAYLVILSMQSSPSRYLCTS